MYKRFNLKNNGHLLKLPIFVLLLSVSFLGSCNKKVQQISMSAVDLGLPSGNLWGATNLGASSCEEAGYYFFWGDIEPCKKGSRYKYVNEYYYKTGGEAKYLKYVTDSEFGVVDNKTSLEPNDDAALVMLDGSWVTPTIEDFKELLNSCKWKESTINGVEGVLCVGPNGNSLFFPNLGHHTDALGILIMPGSRYWSQSLSEESNCESAEAMSVSHYSEGMRVEIGAEYRAMGGFIRPVKHTKVHVTTPSQKKKDPTPSATKPTPTKPKTSAPKKETDVPQRQITSLPKFPGGDKALTQYMSDNLRYSPIAQENGIQGKVICQFVVDTDGSISDVVVVRSVDPLLDREAIRLIKSMPKWIPAMENGKATRMKITVPVNFRLE